MYLGVRLDKRQIAASSPLPVTKYINSKTNTQTERSTLK